MTVRGRGGLARAAAFVATLACLAPTGHAQNGSHSDFWREVRDPGYLRSRELLRQGRALSALAGRARGTDERARLLASTRRFRRALALEPDDQEVLFELARSLAALAARSATDRDGHTNDDAMEEARRLFRELRREHPGYEAQRVAFELGVLAARAHDFEDAAAEYQRALEEVEIGEGAPSTHANLAEVRMLSGRLADAEREYRRAVELADGRPTQALALALFGLAVCVDRRGEPREAMRVMRQALGIRGVGVLRSEGVFFEPAAEIHYYEALALRTQAEDEMDAGARARLTRQAAASLRRYLGDTPHDAPFYELAARRLETLMRELGGHGERQPRGVRTTSGRGRPRR